MTFNVAHVEITSLRGASVRMRRGNLGLKTCKSPPPIGGGDDYGLSFDQASVVEAGTPTSMPYSNHCVPSL